MISVTLSKVDHPLPGQDHPFTLLKSFYEGQQWSRVFFLGRLAVLEREAVMVRSVLLDGQGDCPDAIFPMQPLFCNSLLAWARSHTCAATPPAKRTQATPHRKDHLGPAAAAILPYVLAQPRKAPFVPCKDGSCPQHQQALQQALSTSQTTQCQFLVERLNELR